MKNYRFEISYDGSRYFGWERQPGKDTVQGKLEAVLERMTGEKTELIGAGRTDAGVHAKAMCANAHMTLDPKGDALRDFMPDGGTSHFQRKNAEKGDSIGPGKWDTDSDVSEDRVCAAVKKYMNRYLPDDICVNAVSLCSSRFHARYNATGKLYTYTCYVGEEKPVFRRKYALVLEECPDVVKMRSAAEYLMGEHDFRAFCARPNLKKTTVRTLDRIEIIRKKDYLYLNFHGDGFLMNMVRILTGTLIEVGFGKRKPEEVREILNSLDRKNAGFTAPPLGLSLMQVDYD